MSEHNLMTSYIPWNLTDDDPHGSELVSEAEQQTNANRGILVYLEFVVLWPYNNNIL